MEFGQYIYRDTYTCRSVIANSNLIRMKPFHNFLSKMGVYEVEIHGAKVKVSVIDKVAVVETKIAEFEGFT